MPLIARRARFTAALSLIASVLIGAVLVAPGASAATRSQGGGSCDPTFVPADAPTIPTRVQTCPDGTTFTFAPGLYRMTTQIVPQAGDRLIGAGSGVGGTEIRGSIVVTTWSASGSMWVHTGGTELVGIMPDPCADGIQGCGYRDWLYKDGSFMVRRLSPCKTLTAGQFCVDYSAHKIYIGESPSGHQYEYGTAGQFLTGYRFGDVTVEHMQYDEFASTGGGITAGEGWLVDDVHGHHNHSCGISAMRSSVANPAVIQNSTFDHNGYHGYCDPSMGAKILNNEFSFNNQIGFAHGTGIKLHGTDHGIVSGNDIHDNAGTGIMVGMLANNTGANGLQIVNNIVADNSDAGIQVEHACNTLVDSNTVTGNGGFGINMQNSSQNTISNNVVSVPKTSNDGGIRVFAQSLSGSNNCGPLNDARYNTFTKNEVTMGTMASHGTLGNINGAVNAGGLMAGEVFVANDYHVPTGGCGLPNWYWYDGKVQQDVVFSPWQSTYGQDSSPSGSCTAG